MARPILEVLVNDQSLITQATLPHTNKELERQLMCAMHQSQEICNAGRRLCNAESVGVDVDLRDGNLDVDLTMSQT